jgi:type III secretory pathway component EscR
MSENALLKITALIWLAFTIVSIVFLISRDATYPPDMTIAGLAVLSGGALLATIVVWNSTNDLNLQKNAPKSKRDARRLERLMQLMDEGEIVELETMLKSREYNDVRQNAQ